jgi:hypothetical protein
MKRIIFLLFFILPCCSMAQYAPQAGLSGSTAISATSGQFVAWAAGCTISRGYMNIANPSLGYASVGDSSSALGSPDGGIVSLGDSGIANLTFAHPLINGSGPDFAVFENGFRNTADSAQAFLELAFVEVSSDGVNYFRFPPSSLTQINAQLGNGNYIDATNINNLAGKYVATYGTPFDLDELAGTPGLDVNNITHVRIIDVVGDIGAHASRDNSGHVINDPYPTAFASGGFDLDAVGVIHQAYEGVTLLADNTTVSIYPNPATNNIVISVQGSPRSLSMTLTTITGMVLSTSSFQGPSGVMAISQYPSGMYYLIISDTNGNKWTEKFVKQ